MSIRSTAVQWLQNAHEVDSGIIRASKFYSPEESWTNKAAWAFEVDKSVVEKSPLQKIHLLCEKEPGGKDFYYLQLPGSYLVENQKELYVRSNNRYSIFLSAEQRNLFQDERGKGKVTFSQFLV